MGSDQLLLGLGLLKTEFPDWLRREGGSQVTSTVSPPNANVPCNFRDINHLLALSVSSFPTASIFASAAHSSPHHSLASIPGCCTGTAIPKVTNDLLTARANGHFSVLILLTLLVACDHTLLPETLPPVGFSLQPQFPPRSLSFVWKARY